MSNSSGGGGGSGRPRLGPDVAASGEDVSVESGRPLLADIVEGRVTGQPTARAVLSS